MGKMVLKSEKGASLLETTLIVSLVSVVAISAIYFAGGSSALQTAVAACTVTCANTPNRTPNAPPGQFQDAAQCATKVGYMKQQYGTTDPRELAEGILQRTALWCK